MKIRKLKGFALFETAISLIVASSFITSYNNQLSDKQLVNDILTYSKTSQMAVTQYYQKHGVLPTNINELELPIVKNNDYPSISNLEIGEFGEITITLSDNNKSLAEKTIILEPHVNNNHLTWTCDDGSLENTYRPASCYKSEDNTNFYFDTDEEDEILDFMDEANYL